MLRTFALATFAAATLSLAAQPATPDQLIAKLCPAGATQHTLDADEIGVLNAVAAHYKQHEWSSAKARREGTFATTDLTRHSVPSLASPPVVLLRTIAWLPQLEGALRVELQRHGAPADLVGPLSAGLRSRNQSALELRPPKSSLLPLSCRDLMRMAFLGGAPPAGKYENVSRAISIALPSFNTARKTALILSINTIEYPLEGKMDDLEATLLRKNAAGAWQIEWHSDLAVSLGRETPPSRDATADDYAVFDAVLAHLGRSRFQGSSCVAVVNQTRDASAFIGTYAPKRAVKLVQREALELGREKELLGCKGAIQFGLPKHEGPNGASIVYTLITTTAEGVEHGEGSARLTKSKQGWSVADDTYRRWALRRHK